MSQRCVGIRGATTVSSDTPEESLDATRELLSILADKNGFVPEDLASIFFTVTPDLTSTFPARAARMLGWTRVPMLCANEIPSPAGVPRCVRVLVHWNTDKTNADVTHVYLRNARHLRPDWAHPPLGLEERLEDFAAPEGLETVVGAKPAAKARGGDQGAVASGQDADPGEPFSLDAVEPVAFQGEPGAYSQEAIFGWLGDGAECLPCASFAEAFEAVEEGRAKSALLPVENSTTGSIHQVFDLILEHKVEILAEVILPVHHVLMGAKGSSLSDVSIVRSHPQALEQCQRWIASHGWTPEKMHDTAGSARALAEHPEEGVAAIASRVAAPLYGLDILARDIQDVSANYTRFLLFARGRLAGKAPVKTSVIFATRHVAGDLYSVLAQFAVREINLTKIESRPDRRTPWNYLFYLDFEGHTGQPLVRETLAAIKPYVTFLRVLGSYPSFPLS